jgi:hypothetical protein
MGFGCRWEQHFFPMSEAGRWVADPKYVHDPSTAALSIHCCTITSIKMQRVVVF